MKKIILNATIAFILMAISTVNVSAQSDKPYTEGTVWTLDFISTKTGMTDMYLKNLSEGWVKGLKAAKEAGIILDYKVFITQKSTANDYDLILMTQFKNYAALDGVTEKFEAVYKKIFGNEDVQHKQAISRNDMRELFGTRITQELIYK